MQLTLRSRSLAAPFGIALIALSLVEPGRLSAENGAGDQPTAVEIVSSFGLRAVDSSPAVDVELSTLGGEARRLSDYHGRWIVVTFFATWCGPCRSEMPSLEALHQRWSSRGVAVVGISIDEDRSVVGPFLSQLGVTFPTLWDSKQEAARTYRATSIPLTYIIDPDGSVVGVSRGARDWMQLEPMVASLVEAKQPSLVAAEDSVSWSTASQVELPPTFSPPLAEVRLSEARVSPGDSFELEIELEWAGELRDYLPHPPWVELPESLTHQGVSATSSSRQGANRVRYVISLLANEAGEFALDPIELRYTPLAESEPVARRVPGPTVYVASVAPLAGLGWPAAAGTAALLGLGTLAWRRRARVALLQGDSAKEGVESRWRERFDNSKRWRIEGRLRESFIELSEMEAELNQVELASEIEDMKFSPKLPSADELDRLERRVEKLLAERMDAPWQKERAQLELRDD